MKNKKFFNFVFAIGLIGGIGNAIFTDSLMETLAWSSSAAYCGCALFLFNAPD